MKGRWRMAIHGWRLEEPRSSTSWPLSDHRETGAASRRRRIIEAPDSTTSQTEVTRRPSASHRGTARAVTEAIFLFQ